MKNLFEMLQAIFGKNVINKTIGTRTNVIKLPSNESNPLKKQFAYPFIISSSKSSKS